MTAKSTLYGLKTISNKILDLAKYSLWRDWEDKAQGRGLIHLEEFQPCLVRNPFASFYYVSLIFLIPKVSRHIIQSQMTCFYE